MNNFHQNTKILKTVLFSLVHNEMRLDRNPAMQLIMSQSLLNWLFPSSKNRNFQNEAKCKTFLLIMSFICTRIKKIISILRLGQLGNGLADLSSLIIHSKYFSDSDWLKAHV